MDKLTYNAPRAHRPIDAGRAPVACDSCARPTRRHEVFTVKLFLHIDIATYSTRRIRYNIHALISQQTQSVGYVRIFTNPTTLKDHRRPPSWKSATGHPS